MTVASISSPLPTISAAVYGLVILGMSHSSTSSSSEPVKDQSVKQLVASLASPNEPPRETSGSPREKFEPGSEYSFQGQRKVCEAAEELIWRGKSVIPELLSAIADDRYSASRQSPSGAVRNVSVGQHCRLVLRLIIYSDDRVNLPDDLDEWWAERENLELWEIQLVEARKRLAKSRSAATTNKITRQIETLEREHRPILNDYPWHQFAYEKGSIK